jgi:nitrogen fixation/metabolism regulation signal transduction histidine kinase
MAGSLYFTIIRFLKKIDFFLESFVENEVNPKFYSSFFSDSLNSISNNLNKIAIKYGKAKLEKETKHLLLQDVINQFKTGILMYDETEKIILSNNAFVELTDIEEIRKLGQLNQIYQGLTKLILEAETNSPVLIKTQSNKDHRHLSIKKSIILSNQIKYNLLTFNDIRKELEYEEVENWQKLIRILRHEIMNSVTPITTLSSTLVQMFNDKNFPDAIEKENRESIDITFQGLLAIEKRGIGLMEFVNNYKKLSNIPEPIFNDISLKGLINDVLALFNSDIEQQNILVEKNTEEFKIIADEKLISQVIINIFKNAFDAVKNNQKKKVEISAYQEFNTAILIITDNGKGIPTENMNEIFIPFFTTKENGSGIGLSLSRQIMQMHKGNITVHSTEGEGTNVKLEFL